MIVNSRWAALARSGLAVHLHGELLRQPAVEALDAFHVNRVGRLVQQGAVVRRVRTACRIRARLVPGSILRLNYDVISEHKQMFNWRIQRVSCDTAEKT